MRHPPRAPLPPSSSSSSSSSQPRPASAPRRGSCGQPAALALLPVGRGVCVCASEAAAAAPPLARSGSRPTHTHTRAHACPYSSRRGVTRRRFILKGGLPWGRQRHEGFPPRRLAEGREAGEGGEATLLFPSTLPRASSARGGGWAGERGRGPSPPRKAGAGGGARRAVRS